MNIKILFSAAIFWSLSLLLSVNTLSAQSQTAWSQCPDGKDIVRCQTFDCPQGDTNKDGLCDLKDEKARLTDARNDSFCANPTSGCGQVNYFSSDSNSACSVRVKENDNNCDLYKAGDPNFATPTPTKPSATPTPTSSPSPVPKGGELPDTGPGYAALALIGVGALGLTIKKFSNHENF